MFNVGKLTHRSGASNMLAETVFPRYSAHSYKNNSETKPTQPTIEIEETCLGNSYCVPHLDV